MKILDAVRRSHFVCVGVACLLALCSCITGRPTHGIPNLFQVEEGVWRGGQPGPEGWAWLKSQGVIFDLKLNTESEASDALAKANGIQVVRVPITTEQQTIGKPSKIIIDFAVACITAGKVKLPNGGIFVHCEHGQDRTGLAIGAYRVEAEHWTKDTAWREMLSYGFHPELLGLYRSWKEDVR